jgi:hydroxyacylglutathione hydrolase
MALDVTRLSLGPYGTNCYVVRVAGGAEAVVIDPGAEAPRIQGELEEMNASCAAILITHGHWDHLGAVADLADATGAPVYIAGGERALLERPADFVPPGTGMRAYSPDVALDGDEQIEVGGISFETLRVPGHSPAHLAYATDGTLFSGDVLFAGSVGRADLPGADWDLLMGSIAVLVDRFPSETLVYPGHGPPTTLGDELAANPFLAEIRRTRPHPPPNGVTTPRR